MPGSSNPGSGGAAVSAPRRAGLWRSRRGPPDPRPAESDLIVPDAVRPDLGEGEPVLVPGPERRGLRWRRVLACTVVVVVLAPLVWYSIALFQVWRTARTDQAGPAQAIIVLGAAQYDGRPSPVLETRLEHTLDLWQQGLAPYIVVTGGRQPGDRFTEASASAQWLIDRGVPDEVILREVQGATTWESLAASARFLQQRGITDVLIVSDPYHLLRAKETAEEVGLRARTSPVPNSLVTGWAEKQHMLKEAAGVAVARLPFVGYRRLLQLTG